MENLKFEFHAVIKFLCKVGRAAKKIYDRLRAVSMGAVHRLTAQLPDDQMSFSVDVSRSKMTRGPAGRLTHLYVMNTDPQVLCARLMTFVYNTIL